MDEREPERSMGRKARELVLFRSRDEGVSNLFVEYGWHAEMRGSFPQGRPENSLPCLAGSPDRGRCFLPGVVVKYA
jgi:hypothetical protein